MFGGANPPDTPPFLCVFFFIGSGAGVRRAQGEGAGVGECCLNEPAAVSTTPVVSATSAVSTASVVSSTATPHYTPPTPATALALACCVWLHVPPPSVSTEKEGRFVWGLFSSKISCAGEVKAGWVGAFIGVNYLPYLNPLYPPFLVCCLFSACGGGGVRTLDR